MKLTRLAALSLGFSCLSSASFSVAAPPNAPQKATPAADRAEEVEVGKLREQYWAQGKEADVGVVQNRIYSKKHKFELALAGGRLSGDPFLSIYTVGGNLGYYFNEYFSVHGFVTKAVVSPSSALETLQRDFNTTSNTNEPRSFWGAEARGSLMYGKLSLNGVLILYFDAFLTAGVGQMGTESGSNMAYFVGIGQQIHVSQLFSLNLDYKFIRYNEDIIGKTTANLGQFIDSRANNSSLVTLSASFMFDLWK